MLGHARPVYLGFRKGGKMVATAGGVTLALAPLAALCCLAVWIVCFAVLRYASVASIVTALALPLFCLLFDASPRWSVSLPSPLSPSSPSITRTSAACSPARSRGSAAAAGGRRPDPHRRRRALLVALLPAAVAALTLLQADPALAAPWCGTPGSDDRPPAVAGPQIRVVYVIPSDGADRSAAVVPQMSADVDAIEAWWQGQDPTRSPRFDRAAFACGAAGRRRAPADAADRGAAQRHRYDVRDHRGRGHRTRRRRAALQVPRLLRRAARHGPGSAARVAVSTTGRVSRSSTSARAPASRAQRSRPTSSCTRWAPFRRLARSTRAAPRTPAHACDSNLDIMWPFATLVPFSSLVLDVNRDDYYAHSGYLDRHPGHAVPAAPRRAGVAGARP